MEAAAVSHLAPRERIGVVCSPVGLEPRNIPFALQSSSKRNAWVHGHAAHQSRAGRTHGHHPNSSSGVANRSCPCQKHHNLILASVRPAAPSPGVGAPVLGLRKKEEGCRRAGNGSILTDRAAGAQQTLKHTHAAAAGGSCPCALGEGAAAAAHPRRCLNRSIVGKGQVSMGAAPPNLKFERNNNSVAGGLEGGTPPR